MLQDLQNVDGHSLPYGPLFMSPKPVPNAAMEAMFTGPDKQKRSTLQGIFALFSRGASAARGAYGNAETDTLAYLQAKIAPELVYIVNEEGVLRNEGDGSKSSYKAQAEDIDRLYPPVNRDQTAQRKVR